MALFYECMLKCARKLLDTADIVRDAIFQQLRRSHSGRTGGSAQFLVWCRRVTRFSQFPQSYADPWQYL